MRKIVLFFLTIIITFSLIGCSKEASLETGQVNVIVSRDFGSEELATKSIGLSADLSVIEVMEENFHIETAYGGGFINAINGLKSGFTGAKEKKKIDWFYYVNGIMAQVGASEYYLKPKDLVIWDYHDWSNNIYGSSIIGAYPMNFINGHVGNILKTEILYAKDYKEESREVLEFLKGKGLQNIELKKLDEEGLDNGEINSIVIGAWDEISKFSYIKDIYNNGKKSGLFFKFDKNIKGLNQKGQVSKEYEKGAVITSIVKEYGLTGTMWLITGNDKNSIKRAVKLLYEAPEKIKGAFSVIVTDDDVVKIPVKN